MPTTNRVVVSAVLAMLVVAAAAFAVAPSQVLTLLVSILEGWRKDVTGANRLVVSLVSVLLGGVCLALLALELRISSARGVVIARSGGATAEVTIDAVNAQVQAALQALPGVQDVRPAVASKGKSVDVSVALSLAPDVAVKAKSDEIMATVREVVETGMGARLGRLRLSVAPMAGRAVSRAAAAPVPESPSGIGVTEEPTSAPAQADAASVTRPSGE